MKCKIIDLEAYRSWKKRKALGEMSNAELIRLAKKMWAREALEKALEEIALTGKEESPEDQE
jgi:hypothetical protein